jgi:hypothetical protein
MNDAVVVCVGDDAWAQLNDDSFVREWDQLYDQCPWATCLQSSAFVRIWFDNYRTRFSPVIVSQRAEDLRLVGLLVLGACKGKRRLVVAGAHQAEYQAWLTKPEDSDDFILCALAQLESFFPRYELTFKYLPERVPVRAVLKSKSIGGRAELKIHQRDLREVRGNDLESCLGKTARQKFNRLKKMDDLKFERIRDYDAFAAIFDDVISFYDFRQGAVNGAFPFGQDELKKAFHLDMMKRCPDLLHVTLTSLQGKPLAAHISMVSKNQVHTAILAHSPFYAWYSPGTAHFILLAKHLLHEGFETLDFTPGGGYKERFASRHDVVHELVLHKSVSARIVHSLGRHSKEGVKRGLRWLGVRSFKYLKHLRVMGIPSQLYHAVWTKTDYRVYLRPARSLSCTVSGGPMKKDHLPDLLKFEPTEASQTKEGFMAEAQRRLERGDHVYTYSQDRHLSCCCWHIENQRESPLTQVRRFIPEAQSKTVLCDFQAFSPALSFAFTQQLLEQVIADVDGVGDGEKLCLFVRGDNKFIRRGLTNLGFQYRCSVSSLRFFGLTRQRVYISASPAETGKGRSPQKDSVRMVEHGKRRRLNRQLQLGVVRFMQKVATLASELGVGREHVQR